jgi:hypothetical protein
VRVVVVVLAVAALAVASAAAARDPRAPQQRHTKADGRLARSIALTAKDVASIAGGWQPQPAPRNTSAGPCSSEPDESMLVQTSQIDPSFVWADGVTTIGSEVDVFRTAAQARRDWRLSTLGIVRACLLESARQNVGKGAHVSVLSARALAPPGRGERSFHFRLVFEVKGKTAVPVVTDLVGLGVGRISVVLHTFSLQAPLPAKAVDKLTTLLSRRLGASSTGI